MDSLLLVLYAALAALGNAMFALGQRQSLGIRNGLVFVAGSAAIAVVLALATAPFVGAVGTLDLRAHWRAFGLSGAGLFLTYVGFNLLYTRFGTSPYVVYAALAIITTSVGVGILYLKEPVNGFHLAAIGFAVVAIVLFAIGQARA